MPKFHVHVEHIGVPKDGVALHRQGVMEVEASDMAHARDLTETNLRSGLDGVRFGNEKQIDVADDGTPAWITSVHQLGAKAPPSMWTGASLAAPSTIAAPPVARGVGQTPADERDETEPDDHEGDGDEHDPNAGGDKPVQQQQGTHTLNT